MVKQIVRSVVRKSVKDSSLTLAKPTATTTPKLERQTFDIAQQESTRSLLKQVSETVEIKSEPHARRLHRCRRTGVRVSPLDLWLVHGELTRLYAGDGVPVHHLTDLAGQIEKQICRYEVREETVEVALALVKPDGFERVLDADGTEF